MASKRHHQDHAESDIVELNVGGRVFTTTRTTLCAVPATFLCGIVSDTVGHTRDSDGRVFIDMNADAFAYVLEYLRAPHKRIVLPESAALRQFVVRALDYCGISRRAVRVSPELRDVVMIFGGYNSLGRAHATVLEQYTDTVTYGGDCIGAWRVRGAEPRRGAIARVSTDTAAAMLGYPAGDFGVVAQGAQFDPVTDADAQNSPNDLHADTWHMTPACSTQEVDPIPRPTFENDMPPSNGSCIFTGWRTATMLPVPCCYAAFVAVDAAGAVFASGGLDNATHNKPTDVVQRYDIERRVWSTTTNLPTPLCNHVSVSIADRVYVLGGWNGTAASKDNHTRPALGDIDTPWIPAQPVPAGRYSAAAATLRDRIMYMGGCNGKDLSADTFIYDTHADRWYTGAATAIVHTRAAAVANPDRGVVYRIGGRDGNQVVYNTCARYDPRAGQWDNVAPMHQGRCSTAAVYTKEGPMVMGGFDGRVQIGSVERYDERANTWTCLDPLPMERDGAGAVVVHYERYNY